ncbi:hypothetical protein [Plantactinospora sonchi]|uniref:Uncharacterized protein n=1 Tax=Plantactinospora sonchi TaxID=1544735 RepID=A0ABU7RS26_9ACTN
MTTDAPAPVWPVPQPEPPADRRRRRVGYAVVAGWAVLLLGAAAFSALRDEPTVREQRSLSQARPIVDRALGDLMVAAGPEPVVELGQRRLDDDCRLTVLRRGEALTASVTFRTPEADAPALLDRIAQRLPGGYRAGVWHSADGAEHTLHADAGEFVAVSGDVTQPGLVRLTVRTGCRPDGEEVTRAVLPLPPDPADGEPGRVLAVLGATEPTLADLTFARCPNGDVARTDQATGQGAPAESPGALLPRPAGTVVVADTPELYAYRAGRLSVVVEAVDGRTRVAVTTHCSG